MVFVLEAQCDVSVSPVLRAQEADGLCFDLPELWGVLGVLFLRGLGQVRSREEANVLARFLLLSHALRSACKQTRPRSDNESRPRPK